MPFSFILRCFIRSGERKCCRILSTVCVTVPATGGWIHLWKIPSERFAGKLETDGFSARFPAVWILRWLRCFCQKPSENSWPVYLSTTVCCANMKGTRWRPYLGRRDPMIWISSGSMPGSGIIKSWPVWKNRRRNGKLSVRNLSGCSRKKRKRSEP